jgi:hypothetical protein
MIALAFTFHLFLFVLSNMSLLDIAFSVENDGEENTIRPLCQIISRF